jgi:ATP-binding cassette subfamily C (CFTR/MRP) protein 1
MFLKIYLTIFYIGAGKSSLFKGLFRCIDRSKVDGVILIDDIDISRITLNHLRAHLSIIPQQPILFHDTLRYNLDPFNHYSDEQCFMALEAVQMKEFVCNNPAGLLLSVAESGSNLSAGQCQMICIARAILKKSQIVLVDEATANIDEKTEELIQAIIADKFQGRTILTIAHRLNTVTKNDRILVLDKGVIINCDTPSNILHYYQ